MNNKLLSERNIQQFLELWKDHTFFEAIFVTLYMTIISTAVAYIFGLLIGIILYITSKKGIKPMPILNKVLGFIVNIFRSIPFVILIVALMPFTFTIIGTSVGNAPMILTLIIASAPYIARVVEQSLNEVNRGVIEAAESMGANTFQIIWKVLLPEASPSLVNGFIICIVTIISYTAMAGSIGAEGLGQVAIDNGHKTSNYLVVWFCVIILVIIVQLIQEFGTFISKKIDKRIR